MATALLQITRVDDSVRGRGGPYIYFWGMTYSLRRFQLLIELFIETIRHSLEMKSPPPITSVRNNKQIYCVLINNQWHRALLMELKMNPVGTLEVFCIDSGGTYLVHLACIRTLDIVGYEAETLRTWPALATKFILADVVAPCSAESFSRHWSEEAMLFLKAQLENHTWKSELTGMYGNYQKVKLYDSHNQALATVMVQQGFGIAVKTFNQTTEIFSSILCDIMGKHAAYSESSSQFDTSLRKASTSFMFPSTHDPQQVYNVTLPTLSDVPTTIPGVKPVARNVALTASPFVMPVVKLAAEESLYVSFAGKPGHFYGQLEKMCETIVTMTAELKAAYASKPNPTLFADTKSHLMEFGVVKMEDREMYYRVLVIKELESHVEVLFIDYGNKFLILRKQVLYPLDCLTHFCQPPGGIECKLDSGETLSISAWKSIITGKRIKVRIGSCVDGIYSVTFTNDPCNQEVSKILLRDISPTPPSSVTVAEVGNGRDLTKDASLDDSTVTNSISKDMEQKPVETDAVSVPLPFEVAVASMAEKCSVEEIPVTKPAISPITPHGQLRYPEQQILSDVNRKIEVVFVDNPSSFYVHLSDNSTVIDDLAEKLNIVYADEFKPAIKDAKPGSPCVVRFEEDRRWYRSQIDKNRATKSTDSLVNVLFVDYGNTQCTPLDQLKVIDEEFLELPPQAFHCRLDGIDLTRTWTIEEKKKFETHCIGKTVSATFAARDSDAKYPVLLAEEKSGRKLFIKDNIVTRNPTIIEQPTIGYTALSISNTSMDVNITWYYNPNRFFISPVDLTAYQNVLEEFEKYYSSLIPNELIEKKPSVGLSCVARFMEDGRYYRSQILSIQDEVARIIFVDYGNEQHTPLSELKRMHERFMEFPQLAWPCKLKGVKKASPINPDAQKHLAACFVIGQTAKVLFEPSESDGKKEVLGVNLAVPKIGDVSQYLIEHKILERISLESEVKIMPQVMEFTTGQIISAHAIVAYIVSPTDFSVILEPKAFHDIMDRIYVLTTNPDFITKKNFKPSIDKPCLALFLEDGLWYRAVIEAVDGDDVEVSYIDYGNKCIVKSSSLAQLPSDLARIPALAFKCCLDISQALPNVTAKAFQSVVGGHPNVIVRLIRMVDDILHVHLSSTVGVDLKKLFSSSESAIASALEEKVEAATEAITTATLELEGIISYYSSSNIFWFQLKKNLADMNAMENSLPELYPKGIKSHRVKSKPEVNQIYAAYHPVYFVWQRACVNKCSDYTAEVYFLDYGDYQTVSISNIGYLPRRFRNVPPFAVRCYLKNVWKPVELTTRVLATLNAVCLIPDTPCRVVLERRGSEGIPFVVSFFVGDQDIFELLATDGAKAKSLKLVQLVDRIAEKGWMGEELLSGLEVPPTLQYLDLM